MIADSKLMIPTPINISGIVFYSVPASLLLIPSVTSTTALFYAQTIFNLIYLIKRDTGMGVTRELPVSVTRRGPTDAGPLLATLTCSS